LSIELVALSCMALAEIQVMCSLRLGILSTYISRSVIPDTITEIDSVGRRTADITQYSE
jgi:hypothetical protein